MNMADVNFIFCNHPLYPKKVDEDYDGSVGQCLIITLKKKNMFC